MDRDSRIFVAGHRGLVGSALVRSLTAQGYHNQVCRTRADLDLRHGGAVRAFFQEERPEYVFLAAARVGGILANATHPVEFLLENLEVQNSVIRAAHESGVKKLLFLGSSCIYPRMAPQPIKEEYLLSGPLEPTNDAYAVAKIAGIKLCHAYHAEYGAHFLSVMPTNLYGPDDNFDLQSSHVLPALLRKFHTSRETGAPEVTVWGTGAVRREFLHVDDMADACVYLMRTYDSPEIVNIGTGEDVTIRELAEIIRGIVGYRGRLAFDTSKPDGPPRRLLDVSRLHGLGWRHRIGLEEGIARVYCQVDKAGWVAAPGG
ncbi:MAG: GDP-L-fucose synthase [Armatimonadetes bacterium]|nr:GDP-L-fucose synthase [Armatimonadota bacterium]